MSSKSLEIGDLFVVVNAESSLDSFLPPAGTLCELVERRWILGFFVVCPTNTTDRYVVEECNLRRAPPLEALAKVAS